MLHSDNPKNMNLLYHDFPEHFTYTKRTKKWSERRGQFAFGRVYTASPADSERFHLRLLLTHVRGPTSYEALRTVDGVTHPTFKAAAGALGLLSDDTEWRRSYGGAGGG